MQIEPNDHVAQEEPREREAKSEGTGRGDYIVCHGRPPLHTSMEASASPAIPLVAAKSGAM